MQSYLVEFYVPRSRARDVHAAGHRARVVAERLSREGMLVRHVRTTFGHQWNERDLIGA